MKRIVVMVVAVAVVVVATLGFVIQRQELVHARKIVAKRDEFCEGQRFMLSFIRDRIETGVARLREGSSTSEAAAQLETANRIFSKYESLDQLLLVCGVLDHSTMQKVAEGSVCWNMSRRPTCFLDAANAVVRDMSR